MKLGHSVRRAIAGASEPPFIPTPYNKAMVSTLAYDSPREPEGTCLFTYSGARYILATCSTTVTLWKESSFQGTFGRRNALGTLPTGGGEGEGLAFGTVAGSSVIMAGDQNNGEVWGFVADSADLMSTWTRTSAAVKSSVAAVHSFLAYDWDGDGDDEFVFCAETDNSVWIIDYDGSGSLTDPANWIVTKIATLTKARIFAQGCPADLAGNGRADLVVFSRGSGTGRATILEAPAAGSIHSTWTAQTLSGFTYASGSPGGCLADIDGTGVRKDIATFDDSTGEPHYWLESEAWGTCHTGVLPDPTLGVGDSAWMLASVPDPVGGPDILVYTYGDQDSGSLTDLSLFVWDGATWEDRAGLSFAYGHALEARPVEASITGLTGRGELLMADSGGTNGGRRYALFSFYDDANVPTKTPPSIAQSAANSTGGATSITVTLAGAPTNGNLLVAFATSQSSSVTVTPPAGWEPVFYFNGDVGFRVFAKVASGDTAASAWGLSSSGAYMVTVMEISGANTTRPFMCHGAWKRSSGTSTTILNPSIQVDQNGALVLGCWGFSNAQGSAPTYPTGFTQVSFTGGQRRHAVAYKVFTAAGDTGVLNATAAASTNGTGFSLAIRAA